MKEKIKTDRDWQADYDADTMARYEEIMQDKQRRNAAIKAAKEKASDLNKRANAMNKVASTSSKAKSTTKSKRK